MVNRDDFKSFSEAISKHNIIWDVIFDCIGYRPEQVKQTINIFGASTKHYVFLSSDFAIPFYNNPSNNLQEFGYTQYGLNKKLCEEIIVGNNILPWTIFRSCHVYGVGSLLGCFPEHIRDKKLIETIVEFGKVQLVDSGKYIQQPLYVDDLIRILIGCIDNKHTKGNIYTLSGPSTIYSNYYYLLLGELLKKNVVIENISGNQFLLTHPDQILFLQDRIYDDTSKLRLSNPPCSMYRNP